MRDEFAIPDIDIAVDEKVGNDAKHQQDKTVPPRIAVAARFPHEPHEQSAWVSRATQFDDSQIMSE